MIRIVAAMRGQIEGDGQALLTRGEVAPVERVRILGRGEAGILPDRPGLVDVHGGVGAAHEGRQAGIGVEEVEPGAIVGPIDPLHRDAFRREPGLARLRSGRGAAARPGHRCEIRDPGHVPSLLWKGFGPWP
jgi:hypothetical protein